MKIIGALFAVVVIAAGISGCSQDGDLVVKNDSATEFTGHVDKQLVVIDSGMEYRTNIYIGKSLTVIGPKDIDITISGSSLTKKSFSKTVNVKSGETTTFRVTNDAGALDFFNAHFVPVNEVNVKLCDSTAFGPNVLAENRALAPGSRQVVRLDEGCWDILVNYGRAGSLDTVTNVQIEIGKIDTVSWKP